MIRALMTVLVWKLECAGEVREREREVGEAAGNKVQATAAKKIRLSSKTTSNSASEAEWVLHPLEINRDVRKSKSPYSVKNMESKRSPAIEDGVLWEKTRERQAGVKWDRVAEKVRKSIRRNQHDIVFRR